MKRKTLIWGALAIGVASAIGVFLGGGVLAQSKTAKPSVLGRTRVAFMNLNEVLKSYSKYKAMIDQLKAKDKQFMTMLRNKQKQAEALLNESKQPNVTQERKEQINLELKRIRFDMENIRQEAQKEITKLQSEELTKMYREVYQVVTEYAASNGIDVIMQYNEQWDDAYHSPARTVQRMNMPFWPMYYDKSLEITGSIAQLLNARFAGNVPASGK